MRIVLCDDDVLFLSQLHNLVEEFFRTLSNIQPEFALYQSGDLLIQSESRADIAFLDVEMPGVSGIHAGVKLKECNPHVKIFVVTAYPDYLDEAMRFQVFRYLSKPIDKNRLFRNLKDAVYAYSLESREFAIPTKNGVYIRRAEEIVCIETVQRKVLVYTVGGNFVTNKNMDYWRRTLSLPCFFSTHRSFIINMRFVYRISKDTVTLKYQNIEKDTYLSRRNYTLFKDTYLMYMESIR